VTSYVTVSSIAKRLMVANQTVLRWIREGRLEASFDGRRYIIEPGTGEAFCEEYERGCGPILSRRPYLKQQALRVPSYPRLARLGFFVKLDAPTLHRIDAERGDADRSNFAEAAIGYYLNYLDRRRTG
jgi:excisionase family DNA binding protein